MRIGSSPGGAQLADTDDTGAHRCRRRARRSCRARELVHCGEQLRASLRRRSLAECGARSAHPPYRRARRSAGRRHRARSGRPCGSGVDAVMPASFSAALFTQMAWPSTRVMTAGRSRDDRIELARSRKATLLPQHLVPATADDPARVRIRRDVLADARRASSMLDALSRRSACSVRSPRPSTWPCASMRPGSTYLPPPSMTVAPASCARRPCAEQQTA